MPRRLTLLAGLLMLAGFCTSAWSQDSPSLGDLARQLRKDKTNSSSAKVITNDDMGPSSQSGPIGLGAPIPGKPGTIESEQSELDKMEAKVRQLDSTDCAALVKTILKGQETPFPARHAWEEKLCASKQTYVRQGLEVIDRSRQLLSTAKFLQDSAGGKALPPDDPRVKDFIAKWKQVIEYANRADATFMAVAMEGPDLSKQSAATESNSSRP